MKHYRFDIAIPFELEEQFVQIMKDNGFKAVDGCAASRMGKQWGFVVSQEEIPEDSEVFGEIHFTHEDDAL